MAVSLTCAGCRRAADTLYDGLCGWCHAAAGRDPDDACCRITVVPTAEVDR